MSLIDCSPVFIGLLNFHQISANIRTTMDVVKDLLYQKFSDPTIKTFDVKAWDNQVQELINAFIRKRGIHQDEMDNFNSYLPEYITMLKEHVKPYYIDENDHLHQIEILEAHFNLPYEEKVGIDSAERALMRGSYESQIYGVVRYSIRKKPGQDEHKHQQQQQAASTAAAAANASGDQQQDDSSSDEEEEEVEAEEEEEEEEEDETEEDDEEEEAEDIEEEDDDEHDDEEDENGDEGTEEEEMKPTIGESRNIDLKDQTQRPAFFIQKEDFAMYSEVVHEALDRHFINDFPSWIKGKLCWMNNPLREPYLLTKPYFVGCNYLVSRTFKLCPYEEYFMNNRVLALKSDKVEIRCKFYNVAKRFRTNCTCKFSNERLKFRKSQSWFRPPRFMFEIPHEKPKRRCPVMVLAMAYGWTPRNFIEAVRMALVFKTSPEIEMLLTIVALDTEGCSTQSEAIRRMGEFLSKCKTMAVAEEISSYISFTLWGEFFPNLVNMDGDLNSDHTHENLRKGYAIAEATAELIQMSDLVNVNNDWKSVDKRSYTIKRIDTPGEKLIFLSRKYIKHLTKKATGSLRKAVEGRKGIDLNVILNPKTIKLTGSVKNGVWDSKTDATDSNQNKTQMMITGFCSDALHSQVQKIIKFAMKKNSDPGPLLTHPTQTGRVDLFLTPESDRCGIVRNKALAAWITPLVNSNHFMRLIRRIIEKNQKEFEWTPLTNVPAFHKGLTMVKDVFCGLIGWVGQPFKMYKYFVQLRRRCAIWPLLGMEWDRLRNTFYFNCDEGRICRPLIVLDRFKDLLHEMDGIDFMCSHDPVQLLMEKGIIEYLDASEEYCGLVLTAESLEAAIKANCIQTHMEIHGLFSLSITMAKAFCDFNAGPRRMYTGNMEKRSLGLKMFEERGTTVSYSLWYGQDPLLSDSIDCALQSRHKEPNGFNVLVAVLADKSNIEDSYVMDRSAIDVGLAVSSETTVNITSIGNNCIFQKPDGKTKGKAPEDKYHAIKPDGTAKVGAQLLGGDASVGKVFYKRENSEMKKRCLSKFIPWNESYVVKHVSRYPVQENKPAKIIRTSMSKVNIPTEGDKFFFGHGQKGTVSEMRCTEDMPFITTGPLAGCSPNILINVCSFARVTLGLQLEILWGKARAMDPVNMLQYQTAFMSSQTFDERQRICAQILTRQGMKYTGKDQIALGSNGLMVQCNIYTGFAYMRVLKHMARDKLRSRERGPVNETTRQPTVGKKRSGALKAASGENENMNTNSYGMAETFRDVNYESADKFMTYWCTSCHVQAIGCIESSLYFCVSCRSSLHIVRVPMTYITNLAMQELYTAGLGHTVITEKIPEDDITVDEDKIFEDFRKLSAGLQ